MGAYFVLQNLDEILFIFCIFVYRGVALAPECVKVASRNPISRGELKPNKTSEYSQDHESEEGRVGYLE